MQLGGFLQLYRMEILVHTWDLAQRQIRRADLRVLCRLTWRIRPRPRNLQPSVAFCRLTCYRWLQTHGRSER
jgi:hypothetical protein